MKFPILASLFVSFVTANLLRADVAPDLSFSAFAGTDLNTLAGGQVLQARGGLIEFQRGITSQSLFVIDAAPAQVQQMLLHWNPASHGELKVWAHNPLPLKPAISDFSGLNSLPDNASINALVRQTFNYDSSNLQLNAREAPQFTALRGQTPTKEAVVNVWSQILAGRANDFVANNLAADDYVVGGSTIKPIGEIRSLVRSDAKIYRQFQPVLSQTPILPSGHMAPSGLYYDCFDIEGTGTLGTGAMYQMMVGSSILSADLYFYTSSGIYVSAELEELWPITLNGKVETLVWRADMVSTSSVAYLHGTERLASGMLMQQDVKQAVQAFRSEFK